MFNTLDTPNEYSESNVSNQDSKIVSYTAGIRGDLGTNFNIILKLVVSHKVP